MTPQVKDWIERIHWALIRYGEGEYAKAVRLADITGIGETDVTEGENHPLGLPAN